MPFLAIYLENECSVTVAGILRCDGANFVSAKNGSFTDLIKMSIEHESAG